MSKIIICLCTCIVFIKVLNAQNVGIGTTTPAYPLSVVKTGIGISQESPDGSTKVGFYTTSGAAYIQTHTNHNLNFTTNNGSSQLTLSTAGNFGIGTTTPAFLLDINGRMRLRTNGATPGTWYNRNDNSVATSFVGQINDSTFGIYDNTTFGWKFAFNHLNNNLGIGTITPRFPLTFANDVGDKISLWGGSNASTDPHYGIGIQGALMQLYTNSSVADIAFGYGNSNTFTENMRLTGTGNLGVGVSNPTSKVEVVETTNTNSRAMYVGINNASASNEGLRVESISGTNGTAILAYRNGNGTAVLATTLAGTAVNASSGNTAQDVGLKASGATGVYGIATLSGGFGVRASNNGIAGATALWAQGYSFISGNLDVIGNLSKSSGSFKIDHPQDPENKFLFHSFVESPDMMNVYNGNTITDAGGFATVDLPSYFEAENIDFKYQLTIMGREFAQALVYEKISNNRFIIKTDKPNIEVSWQVTGVRNDKYAQQNRIVPEVQKTASEKGKYLNPEVFNAPKEKQLVPGKID